jgi:hypothetical protein
MSTNREAIRVRIVSTSTQEAAVIVTLETESGDVIEIPLKPEAFEEYRWHIYVGAEFSMDAAGAPEFRWGRLPHIPG